MRDPSELTKRLLADAQRYFDALRLIAEDFQSAEELQTDSNVEALGYTEVLQMSYENMQIVAKAAVHGKARPQ